MVWRIEPAFNSAEAGLTVVFEAALRYNQKWEPNAPGDDASQTRFFAIANQEIPSSAKIAGISSFVVIANPT